MHHAFHDNAQFIACLHREEDRERMEDWNKAELAAQARKAQEIELAYDQHELAAI